MQKYRKKYILRRPHNLCDAVLKYFISFYIYTGNDQIAN